MKARIQVILLAIACVLAVPSGQAASYELWAAGTLWGSTMNAIARYSGTDGSFLGYFMHPTNGVGTVLNPGDGTIGAAATDGTRIYVAHGPQGFTVNRYDRGGNNAMADLIAGPGGSWYQGKYWYPIKGLSFTDDHIYLLSAVHTVSPAYPELERGSHIFRHNLNGSNAGIQPPTTPSGYSRGAQFSAYPPLTNVTDYLGMAMDSTGNVYAIAPGRVTRYAPDGQYFGPGGLGDTTPWLSSSALPSGFVIASILVDGSDRVYLSGHAGGVTSSQILRFNADRSPAPAPGQSGAVFTYWTTYLKGVVNPTAMAIGPLDGHLYAANNFINAPTRYENMISRYYTTGVNDGKMIGPDGGFANLGGSNSPMMRPNVSLFFVNTATTQGTVFSVR